MWQGDIYGRCFCIPCLSGSSGRAEVGTVVQLVQYWIKSRASVDWYKLCCWRCLLKCFKYQPKSLWELTLIQKLQRTEAKLKLCGDSDLSVLHVCLVVRTVKHWRSHSLITWFVRSEGVGGVNRIYLTLMDGTRHHWPLNLSGSL